MSTTEPRDPLSDDEEDTAELPALPDAGEVPDPDRASSTDSWAVPEGLRAAPAELERANAETVIGSVVELGAARRNLASMAENRGQLENSLHALNANLREVEAQLVIKTVRIAEVEKRERSLQAQVEDLERLAQREQAERQAAQNALLAAQGELAELRGQLDSANQTLELLRVQSARQGEELIQARQALAAAVAELRAAEERSSAGETALLQREQQLQKQLEVEMGLHAELRGVREALAERDALIARVESEAASGAAVLGSIRSSLEHSGGSTGEQQALDQAVRLLVRQDDGREVVHVLARRTLVGRGLECQLRIDAEYVSRRHALLLVSSAATVIEDLDSTNGVFVNGVRVKRRVLAEGDEVMIGKTRFRFRLQPLAAAAGS